MIILLFGVLTLIMTLSCFNFSFRVNGVEASFHALSDDLNTIDPYFAKEKFINYVVELFEINMTRYVTSYELGFLFFNPDNGLTCSSKCRGAQIRFTANVVYGHTYTNYMVFKIVEN